MSITKAEIITIGDEILYGQTLDTNAHWMSSKLSDEGIKVIRRTTVGDTENEILEAFNEAESRADIILITGGLGPTSDDLTKPCLAKYFNSEIKPNEQATNELKAYMASRGRELNYLTSLQAHLPEVCQVVSNEQGTAPGMWFEKDGKVFVSMPGVPHEMEYMMEHHVIPRLKKQFTLSVIYHKIVRVAGIGESWLAERIKLWEDALPENVKLAYLPTFGDIKLRLTAIGDDKEDLKNTVNALIQNLLPMIDGYFYGFDDDTLESVIGKILRERKQTMAIAESCTGGFIAHQITKVPGSSDYFNGAIVPYQNKIKHEQLGVSQDILDKYGAVSEETVSEMALNVREKLDADFGLASSGIAGPGGGTEEKPVGLIWIAIADRKGVETRKLRLTLDRPVNIRLTSVSLLHLFHQRLLQID